ncbi:DUF1850 domain-containing protein [Halanaerobium salsuginis]|uniref:DUF1850 domain-containing protein n=1 Tax=Halanaerobium salsuginis TaxID=29563 RepID=A0A1I4KVA2_9FIRM|nr:DUF1850 domain-containing protein [Halanaerobium salsuginis]SFL82665.1 hypothetical protein SAMN02983006_02130 [Halanaerobium salsuginis]
MKDTRLSFVMLKTKKFKFFLFIFFLLIITVLLLSLKVNTLQLVDYKKNNIFWQEKAVENAVFKISYIHSVERTPVIEIFKIKQGKIILTGTEYESYGAGLPTTAITGEYVVKNDKFFLKDINQFLPDIMLRVSDYAQHEFIYQDQVYELYKKIPTETLVQIRTKQVSYFNYYQKEVKKWLKKNI